VHDDLDPSSVLAEDAIDPVGVADIELEVVKLRQLRGELGADRGRRCLRSEEAGAHVVLDPDHVEALGDQPADRFRADQPARAGDHGDRHRCRT
jgi:hypothetical protein